MNQLGACGNELCFGENAVCQLNKLSVFFLHAILLCTLWGMGLMLKDLRGPMRGGMGHAAQAKAYHGLLCVVFPIVFCSIAFAIEQGNDDYENLATDRDQLALTMANSGFSCYF